MAKLGRCETCKTVTAVPFCPNPTCDNAEGPVRVLSATEQAQYVEHGHAAFDK